MGTHIAIQHTAVLINMVKMRAYAALIFGLLLLVASVQCEGEEEGCVHAGKHYKVGDSFQCEDGCNWCTCIGDGQTTSTMMLCPPKEDV